MLTRLFSRTRAHQPRSARCGQPSPATRAPCSVHTDGDRARSDVVATVIALRESPTRTNPSDFVTFAQRMSIPTGVAVRHSPEALRPTERNAVRRTDRAPTSCRCCHERAVPTTKSTAPPEIFARAQGQVLNHYEVLGVDPTADRDAIRYAWHVKIRLLHPDKHGGAPDEVLAEAAKETLRVNRAWEMLGDDTRRRTYDVHLGRPRGRRPSQRRRLGNEAGHSVPRTTPNPAFRSPAPCVNTKQSVVRSAGRFSCANCKMAWEFAKCEACNGILQVAQRRKIWRCASCGQPSDVVLGRQHPCGRVRTLQVPDRRSPRRRRFNCTRCRRDYFRCSGCGEYSVFAQPSSRPWRCAECRRTNPSSDAFLGRAQRLSFLLSAVCCVGLSIILVARMIL